MAASAPIKTKGISSNFVLVWLERILTNLTDFFESFLRIYSYLKGNLLSVINIQKTNFVKEARHLALIVSTTIRK